MNAVATTQTPLGYADLEKLAASIAQSGLFGIKTKDQAIALMMIAHAEGRHPALAARDYDIISGRPSKKAEAMLRDFLEAGGKVQWNKLDDSVADATFSHPQGGSVRISWDMERARTAGMAGKDNWKKFPRQMLRSRTVSEGVRTVYPLATSGMYEPGEAADMPPPHTGPTLEATAEPPMSDARARINAEIPLQQGQVGANPPQRTRGQFLDALEHEARDCGSLAEVNRMIAHPDTQRAMATFQDAHKARLDGIIAAAIAAHAPIQHPEEDQFGGWPGPDPAEMRREREAAEA